MTSHVDISIDLTLTPSQTFDAFVDELVLALEERGMKFDARPGGKITEGVVEVGSVEEWIAGERISFRWRSKNWEDGAPNTVLITFLADGRGKTRLTVENQDWGRVIGDERRVVRVVRGRGGRSAAFRVCTQSARRLDH